MILWLGSLYPSSQTHHSAASALTAWTKTSSTRLMGQKVIKCSKNAENPSQYYAGVSSYKQAFCVDSQSVIKVKIYC